LKSLIDVVTVELPQTLKQMFQPEVRKRPSVKAKTPKGDSRLQTFQDVGKYKKTNSMPMEESFDTSFARCVTEPDLDSFKSSKMARILEADELKKDDSYFRRSFVFLEEKDNMSKYLERCDSFSKTFTGGYGNDNIGILSNKSCVGIPTLSLQSLEKESDYSFNSNRRSSAVVSSTNFEFVHREINAFPTYRESHKENSNAVTKNTRPRPSIFHLKPKSQQGTVVLNEYGFQRKVY